MAKLFEGADKYKISDYLEVDSRPLGKGSFSVVHVARVKKTGNQVAVKVIEKASLSKQGQQLRQEVSLMKMIDHPNIVKLICLFEETDRVFLVLELMAGGELFTRITRVYPHGYPESVASAMVKRILEGIAYLHDKKIIHRDLKPENLIYVSPQDDYQIKIADFGLAKLIDEESFAKTACGSPSYVAPEVLLRKPEGYGAPVDLWATGVITYVLLCGFCPFYHQNNSVLYQMIIKGEFTFPSPYFDKVSPFAKDFVCKLLQVDPARRWTANQALGHPWIVTPPTSPTELHGTTQAHWSQTNQLRGPAQGADETSHVAQAQVVASTIQQTSQQQQQPVAQGEEPRQQQEEAM